MILIVDDHRDTLYVMVRLLTSEGYQAKGFGSGSEALAYLGQNAVSLVILDFNMPDMDGFEVFHAMQSDPSTKGIPVIMFSASDGNTRTKAIEIGISAYVAKHSMDWANLQREVIRLIGKGTPRPQREDKTRRANDAG